MDEGLQKCLSHWDAELLKLQTFAGSPKAPALKRVCGLIGLNLAASFVVATAKAQATASPKRPQEVGNSALRWSL